MWPRDPNFIGQLRWSLVCFLAILGRCQTVQARNNSSKELLCLNCTTASPLPSTEANDSPDSYSNDAPSIVLPPVNDPHLFQLLSEPSILVPPSVPVQQRHFCAGKCNRNAYCDADQVTCKCVDGYLDMSPAGTSGKICLPITSVGCPPGWETLQGTPNCYRVFPESGLSREQAAGSCRREMPSAKLAIVPSKTMTVYAGNTVDSTISKIGSHKKTWIGLMFDAGKKVWVWPDGNVANFTGWYYGSGPEDPVHENQLCAQIIGGPYGHGSWIPAHCSGAKNKSEADGFMCSVPRKLPPNERPLASHKSFEITCCKKGTPRVDADIQDLVSDWAVNDSPQAVTYDDSCWRFTGSFMLDEGSLMPHQDPSVKCQCPEPGLDSRCHEVEECINGYRSYKIGLRCSCQEPFFGKLCELLCDNGERKKDDKGFDECQCHDYYYGTECNKIHCLNGGIPQENQRSCKCVSEQFTGRHCEYKRFNGDIQNSQYSDADVFNRNLGGTAAGILFIILMGLATYCCARRRANSIMRQLSELQRQQHAARRSALNEDSSLQTQESTDGSVAYSTASLMSNSGTPVGNINGSFFDRNHMYFIHNRNGAISPDHLINAAPPSYDETQTGNIELGLIGPGTPVLPPAGPLPIALSGDDLPTYEDALKLSHPLSPISNLYTPNSASNIGDPPTFNFPQPTVEPPNDNINNAHQNGTPLNNHAADNNGSIANSVSINETQSEDISSGSQQLSNSSTMITNDFGNSMLDVGGSLSNVNGDASDAEGIPLTNVDVVGVHH